MVRAACAVASCVARTCGRNVTQTRLILDQKYKIVTLRSVADVQACLLYICIICVLLAGPAWRL